MSLCVAFAASGTEAQEKNIPREDFGRSLLRGISPLLMVKMFADCAQLKAYVRSEEFLKVRTSEGDLKGVDAIYARALELAWHNIPEALLISAFATMDHRRVGVRLPLLGPLLWFPLTSEFADEFDARLRALPSRLYPDSPRDPEGDRDKLQHFFGSAFIAYSTRSGDPADRIGDFIEETEEACIVGGVNDERDKRSNGHGRSFGLALLVEEDARPSSFITLAPSPAGNGEDNGGCVPDSESTVSEMR